MYNFSKFTRNNFCLIVPSCTLFFAYIGTGTITSGDHIFISIPSLSAICVAYHFPYSRHPLYLNLYIDCFNPSEYEKTAADLSNICFVFAQSWQYSLSSTSNGFPHFRQLSSPIYTIFLTHSLHIPCCLNPAGNGIPHMGHAGGYMKSSAFPQNFSRIFMLLPLSFKPHYPIHIFLLFFHLKTNNVSVQTHFVPSDESSFHFQPYIHIFLPL